MLWSMAVVVPQRKWIRMGGKTLVEVDKNGTRVSPMNLGRASIV